MRPSLYSYVTDRPVPGRRGSRFNVAARQDLNVKRLERLMLFSEIPQWKTNAPAWWVQSAQEHADAGRLEEWVHAYLTTDGWNDDLLKRLRSRQLWWRGPVESRLGDLERICGPEAHMACHPNDPVMWERNVKFLQENMRDPLHVPPLLVEYRQSGMIICDGAHRYEAMCRLGWQSCWAVIWYDAVKAFIQDECRWTLTLKLRVSDRATEAAHVSNREDE